MNGLAYTYTGTADEWGQMVVEHLQTTPDAVLQHYDTVLVDEAHGMQDWQLYLLTLHATRSATICLAMGKGQELYRDDSAAASWLEKCATTNPIKRKELRKNFRNPIGQYFVALAFHRGWPDKFGAIETAFTEVFKRKGGQTGLEFDREGEPLIYLPIPRMDGEFDNDGFDQDRLIATEYAQILQSELVAIRSDKNAVPVGMLVLVPSESSQHARCARLALEEVTTNSGDVSFIDYTDDEVRRSCALSTEIRLCTFHSSRGLEGERVVIFGLEQLESFSSLTGVKPENLGFIALSRGVFSTTVVMRSFFTTPAPRC